MIKCDEFVAPIKHQMYVVLTTVLVLVFLPIIEKKS